MLVANHGRPDLDCFILIALILRATGRAPRLLADHLWFTMPGVRNLWLGAGAVDGTRENAAQLLADGEMVLAYPGGMREIMGGRFGHEAIDWRGRTGFARVAIAAPVPVIPIAGTGINNGHVFVSRGRRLGTSLFQKLLRLGPSYSGYRDPPTIGLVPLPLPFSLAVHLPWPSKVRYVVGDPVYPAAAEAGGGVQDDAAVELAQRVETAMWELIERYGQPI